MNKKKEMEFNCKYNPVLTSDLYGIHITATNRK